MATFRSTNAKYVFASGNQWAREKEAGPFFGMPAAWRRFIFQLLNNREFAVYSYVCAVMDPLAIAYPSPEQIAEDMGLKTRSVVVEALDEIVKLGFLLRSVEKPSGRSAKRTVYQRPLPHYTIAKLLRDKQIDADFFPLRNQMRDVDLTKASDDVVRASIKALLGETAYNAFHILRDPERRIRFLETALSEHVKEKIAEKAAQQEQELAKLRESNLATALPEWMRMVVAEEHPDAVAATEVPF